MTKRHKPLAAIDLGTNSFHLLVVEVDTSTGRFKILDREKEVVRLGSGSNEMKYLSEQAMDRGIETLKRFKKIVDSFKSPVRAVATSAVREALNQEIFIRRVRAETDMHIEIVSGLEEARLIYLGVLQALPVFNKQILMVDIGGGSTEFLVGKQRKIYYDNSLKIGAVRLTERFLNSKKIDSKAIKQCRQYILGLMNPVLRTVKKTEYEIVVGTSGTILNIAQMIRCLRKEDPSSRLNNFSFTKDELFAITEEIIQAKNSNERSEITGLDPKRVDIIVAGVLILEQIFKELKIKEMIVSEYALREGIIFDTIEKKHARLNEHRLDDIRYGSVMHLAESLRYEQGHAQHVGKLAMRMFDQTRKIHQMGNMEREFLEAAAILHEVGLFISHEQHHRHSYYLIRNAELLGFTENEKEIIANIARYHRKSHPKDKHEGFRNLSSDEQKVVTKLASMLRIADGLDRTHSSVISDISCQNSGRSLTMKLKRKKHLSAELELWGANRKKDLFEDTFNKTLKFKFA